MRFTIEQCALLAALRLVLSAIGSPPPSRARGMPRNKGVML
jgi:hypothetical protein